MIALLYDVHGNLPALEAVIADAKREGATDFFLGGDYAMAGAWPAETVSRLRELEAQWIRGNTERWVGDAASVPADPFLQSAAAFARDELGGALASELAGLPESISRDTVLLCHGSPDSDMETFMPEPTPGEADLLAAAGEHETIVFGHSHLQFERIAGGRRLVNPGSVGLPFDGDRRAAYALWRGSDFELRRVTYDWRVYAGLARERLAVALGEGVETLLRRIEQAAFVA